MTKEISIEQFRNTIKRLLSDEPKLQLGIWYKTQKEHWLGWLKYYRGSSAYGRKGGRNREAKFAYNYVVNIQMLTGRLKEMKSRNETRENRYKLRKQHFIATEASVTGIARWIRAWCTKEVL